MKLTDLYRDPVMGVPYRAKRWLDALWCIVGIVLYVALIAWSVTHRAIPTTTSPAITVSPALDP